MTALRRAALAAACAALCAALTGCDHWFQDMKGFLEHWTGTVSVAGIDWSATPESQTDSSGNKTISTGATLTALASIMNPDGYSLNLEPGSVHIGAEGEALKSVRIYGSAGEAARSRASITGSSSTSMSLELLPISSVPTPESRRLEHTDFTITFVPVRSDSGVDSPHTQSLTLRYNTPPRMPLEVAWSAGEGRLGWLGAEHTNGWEMVQGAGQGLDGHIYWAWPKGITDPTNPDSVATFQVYADGVLSQEGSPLQFEYNDGSLVSPRLADYQVYRVAASSGTRVEVYALDVEGVRSLGTGSGLAPHRVTLDASGGFFASSGTSGVELYKAHGSRVSGGDIEAPHYDGHYLSGWSISPGGSPVTFPYSITAPVTLYALWTASASSGGEPSGGTAGGGTAGGGTASTYTISYEANGATGGTIPAAQAKLAGRNVALAANSGGLAKTGYTFAGWNTLADGGGTDYAEGASYKTDASVVLYAQWSANSYTVTFNANDGSGSMSNQSFTYDMAQSLTTNQFTRSGYTFAGWNTQQDGGGTGYRDGQSVSNLTAAPNGTVTLYAQWGENVADVTFSPASGAELYYGDTVTLSTVTNGATIRYTVDGGPEQTGTAPVDVSITGAIITASATKSGVSSAETSATYTIRQLSGISVTPTKRTEYLVGEQIDYNQGDKIEVTATYNGGNTRTVEGTITTDTSTLTQSVGNKTVTVSYSEGTNVQTASFTVDVVEITYQSKATPTTLSGYTSPHAPSSGSFTYVEFGDWPQTIKEDTVQIYEGITKEMGMFTYYAGSDGNYYVKAEENAVDASYTYSDGTTVGQGGGTTKYFKVEPIRWRVLTSGYNSTGKALLLAESILVGGIKWADTSNNYMESYIRQWLNGNSGTADQSDYAGASGFLQSAFTADAQTRITETDVDNSAASTFGTGESAVTNSFACANTTDKVFLLSEQEVTYADYGFEDSNALTSSSRIRATTDYAKATGANRDSTTGDNGGWWWLRSPSAAYNDSTVVRAVFENGKANASCVGNVYVSKESRIVTKGGIVPALCVTLP